VTGRNAVRPQTGQDGGVPEGNKKQTHHHSTKMCRRRKFSTGKHIRPVLGRGKEPWVLKSGPDPVMLGGIRTISKRRGGKERIREKRNDAAEWSRALEKKITFCITPYGNETFILNGERPAVITFCRGTWVREEVWKD